MNNKLPQQIESILFALAEAQSFKSLANKLGVSIEEVKEAVSSLEKSLDGHGVTLVYDDQEVSMVTHADHSALIESIRKEELSKELSKASAETLSIVAYQGGISKAQIEFIRGVNASYTLRALSMRGLIEARGSGRAVGYYPTLQMLEHFGISKVEELPHFAETAEKIKKLLVENNPED